MVSSSTNWIWRISPSRKLRVAIAVLFVELTPLTESRAMR